MLVLLSACSFLVFFSFFSFHISCSSGRLFDLKAERFILLLLTATKCAVMKSISNCNICSGLVNEYYAEKKNLLTPLHFT